MALFSNVTSLLCYLLSALQPVPWSLPGTALLSSWDGCPSAPRLEGPLASAAGLSGSGRLRTDFVCLFGFISNPLQTGAFVKDCENVTAMPSAVWVSEHLLWMFATPARPALVRAQAWVARLQLCPQSPPLKIDEPLPLNAAEHVDLSFNSSWPEQSVLHSWTFRLSRSVSSVFVNFPAV